MVIIVFGLSGAGKTTIGKLLARDLRWRFIEADDFHPAANIEKMRSGHPLTDNDRWPWLEQLRQQIERSLCARENAVLACSALKRAYRDRLHVSDEIKFVFLRGDYALVQKQLRSRHGHFINAAFIKCPCRLRSCFWTSAWSPRRNTNFISSLTRRRSR